MKKAKIVFSAAVIILSPCGLLAGGEEVSPPIPSGVLSTLLESAEMMHSEVSTGFKVEFRGMSTGGGEISKKRAVFYSLLLPGLGERYLRSRGASEFFLGLEASLWLAVLGYDRYGAWTKEDYLTYAATRAGVDNSGKDDRYYVDISNYPDIRAYNDAKRQNRTPGKAYPTTDEFSWSWDSEDSRREFDYLRLKSENTKKMLSFISGGLVLNRILSAIDVVYRYNKLHIGRAALSGIRVHADASGTAQVSISAVF